jgi:hypothetical protein
MSDITLSDAECLQAAADDTDVALAMDEDAFRAFYERTAAGLWGYLSRISGDRQLATIFSRRRTTVCFARGTASRARPIAGTTSIESPRTSFATAGASGTRCRTKGSSSPAWRRTIALRRRPNASRTFAARCVS